MNKTPITDEKIDKLIEMGYWSDNQQGFLDMCAYRIVNESSEQLSKVLYKLVSRLEEPTVMQLLFQIFSSNKIRGLGKKSLAEFKVACNRYGIHISEHHTRYRCRYDMCIRGDNTKVQERFRNNLHPDNQK